MVNSPQTSILMVDDDLATGEVLAEVLEEAGYAVTLARSGADALRLIKEQAFAVVVSDIRMPAIGGIDVLHAARQSATQPEVILLTGYAELDTSLAALRERAFDYLLKPCKPEVLLEQVSAAVQAHQKRRRQEYAIQRLLNEFGQSNAPALPDEPSPGLSDEHQSPDLADDTIQIGALILGSGHHTASLHGQPLHLTPMEHALLRVLAGASGRTVRYRELVYAMHGYDVTNTEAKVLLKTHVRNIRHKIGADYLVNVRGVGYKLIPPESDMQREE